MTSVFIYDDKSVKIFIVEQPLNRAYQTLFNYLKVHHPNICGFNSKELKDDCEHGWSGSWVAYDNAEVIRPND